MDSSHIHITDRDGNYLPKPEPDDVHGWTVLYQTPACDHVHRVLGWVGDLPSATKLSMVASALWHPMIRVTPTPAPTGDVCAEQIGVITDMPEELAQRIHAGEAFTFDELFARGAEGTVLIDEVMPRIVMLPARVAQLMDEKGVDLVTLLTDTGEHGGMRALVRAGGRDVWEKIMAEYPVGPFSPGTGHPEVGG